MVPKALLCESLSEFFACLVVDERHKEVGIEENEIKGGLKTWIRAIVLKERNQFLGKDASAEPPSKVGGGVLIVTPLDVPRGVDEFEFGEREGRAAVRVSHTTTIAAEQLSDTLEHAHSSFSHNVVNDAP